MERIIERKNLKGLEEKNLKKNEINENFSIFKKKIENIFLNLKKKKNCEEEGRKYLKECG